MYNEHFGFNEAPFNVTPDSRFFFVTPCYEEAFATLSYGIEARKGVIVLTGEAGTGKTTLLKRLTSTPNSTVQGACIFDPHLSFVELLRLALAELGLEGAGGDRLAMMTQLYDHLVRQLESGRIVCLMIDEAQSLSEEMLEELRLLSNLETDSEKLIQIVLAGQRELDARLDGAGLAQLKQRVALRCRLKPLQPHEVGRYIDFRLRTVSCARRDLFEPASIERIARYSRGVPRLINSICDNALLIAFTHNRRSILASDVDEAAQELELEPLPQPSANAAERDFANAAPPRPFEFQSDRRPKARGAPRDEAFDREFEPPPLAISQWPVDEDRPEVSATRSSGWLLMFLVAATALFLGMWQKPGLLPEAYEYIWKLGNRLRREAVPAPPSESVATIEGHQAGNTTSPADVPAPQTAAVTKQPLQGDEARAAKTGAQSENRAVSALPDGAAKTADKSSTEMIDPRRLASKNVSPPDRRTDRVAGDRALESQIDRAIRDRAISGVRVVSASDGTVFLDGRVATMRQKLAAVRAALSVPGVKNVRDRIVVQ